MAVGQGSSSEYTLDHDGILYFHDRYCVPKADELRRAILQEANSSPYLCILAGTKCIRISRSVNFELVLEDMLRGCVTDSHGFWEDLLSLVEFVYNNSYMESIRMAPYEAMYRRRCRTPIYWTELHDRNILGPELVREAENIVRLIHDRLIEAFEGRSHMQISDGRISS
ncbi:uncharacterized protein LOC120215442 [Hibiscus syriacus]|uniref:uncharacterized protein LOC120215442 n=1 Tax=Hibiscus syriacus TaxID=106335 RepID=UPI00192313FE|nr:uncharacterized protein LOC120215442 [Hibiscus syriacus]